jgi:hypothetical protein
MDESNLIGCTAFNGDQLIASGNLLTVARKVKKVIDQDEQASVLIFNDDTSELVELDFRGTMKDVLERLETTISKEASANSTSAKDQRPQRGPGRPKLGVVAREITLLPRHWDWLNSQPGGASVTLRKLVEEARRVNSGKDKVRRAKEVAYRFMSAMAGNFPGFEEAARALFAGDAERFDSLVDSWSTDIRDHARKLAKDAFQI